MASSSSSSPSAPAFFSRYSYHVFLSFRGEDTRKIFVGHLYSALEQKGIHTYKDDKTLPRGETIEPALVKAIEESEIAIVVFSENYADSAWCLNELEYIMQCERMKRLIVMPIFYDVEPSKVRKQKGKYGQAFDKHEKAKQAKVGSWRKALREASNISGWESSSYGDDSEFIKVIVKETLQKLHPLTSGVNDNLVGIEARVEVLRSKLEIGKDDVRFIGIWGVGGGGKTTLASYVYSEVSREFDGCCFVDNVGEKSRKRNGLPKLQEEILSGVSNEQVHVGGVELGKHMIKERLCCRKVLIVLDDVDHHDQLEALAGSVDWFCKESRVIITTRNMHLLKASGAVVHNMSLLTEDEAIKLFHKHAFKNYRPMEDFEWLSKEVVSYAGGLPLALKVFGRLLCDRDMHEWISTLARLKEIPDGEILKKLKISYDGLEQDQKELFLDIACFFRREYKNEAMEILDACGFHPVIGVKVLVEKALITISEDGEFDMHDLIHEMAHYIAGVYHKKNPEKQSRIWEEEDVVNICAMDPTTDLDMIEAIRYRYYGLLAGRDNPLEDLPPIVANTKNLRWIDWEGDLASPFLTNFPQRTLCYLQLHDSPQKQLWEGRKYLPNLKILDLSFLHNLIMTPDFSGLPNLEIFKLLLSANLKEVHSSLGDLKRLVTLSIEVCKCIEVFPSIARLTNLKTLSFHQSPTLFGLSEIQQYNMNHRIRLWFSHRNLTKLNLSFCHLGDEDIDSSVWELPNVQELHLGFNNFSRLDFSLLRVPKLKWLNVTSCYNLVALSDLPSSIAVVLANGCFSLKTFGDTSSCKWLWKVSLLRGELLHFSVMFGRLVPFEGGILLDSMLQGNAIEDHFISVSLESQIPMGFVGRFFGGKTFTKRLPHVRWDPNTKLVRHDSHMFTLCLPDDWYNDFCGFLIRLVVTQEEEMSIDIIIQQEEADEEDSGFEIWQESNEEPEPEYDGEVTTYVGYVSFHSLRHTTLLTSSYNLISFSIDRCWISFTTELVPRKSKDDPVQTTQVATDSSEFRNKSDFVIKQDSKSSIKISWVCILDN